MVMPCYNKVKYIGNMFDSIIAQEWNNIELILVNDGSTDGTREVIAEYETRFVSRGYKVVIIDQENAGVCAAVKVGLECVTGNYVCLVDADDELSPNYCSVMAGAMEADVHLDYVACSYVAIFKSGEKQLFSFNISKNWCGEQLLRFCLLNASFCMSWPYMLRFDYFKKCRIVETFPTDTRGSHEPCFLIPIHAYAGNFRYLKENPLYMYYCERENAHSEMTDTQKVFSHWAEYKRIGEIVILSLPEKVAVADVKKRFINYLTLFEKLMVFQKLCKMSLEVCYQKTAQFNYIREVKNSRMLSNIKNDYSNINLLLALLNARCICIGAKGKNAAHLIPKIKKIFCIPIEYWDENAVTGDTTLDGDIISTPDYEYINSSDIVLVLPSKFEIVHEIEDKIKQTKCKFMLYAENINAVFFAYEKGMFNEYPN